MRFSSVRRTQLAALVAVLASSLPGIAAAQGKTKVAAIYTVPFEQQWVSRIHKAANAAKDRGDIEYVATENVSNTDYERVLREYAEAGNKLILGEVFGVEEAARSVAADYPETAFAQIDGGADVMYAERFGVSDAAKEKGVLAIGNVIDTQADYPETVVASALWHFEPTLDKAIAEVKAGTFKAADYGVYSFMKEGGCSLAPLGTFEGKVPADVMAKVAEKEKAIEDGSLVTVINDEEPKSS